MVVKKRYHSVVNAPSQACRSAIEQAYMLLQVEPVNAPVEHAGIPTILSFLQFIGWCSATGVLTTRMSASTHLERSQSVLGSFQMRADQWHVIQNGQLMTKYVLGTHLVQMFLFFLCFPWYTDCLA